jgi:hypothetical protein
MERYHSNDQFGDAGDLDALLYPSQAFGHPSEVVSHPDLTVNEKRAILTSWASDACAMQAVPTLRRLPGGRHPVHFDEVMDALRALDEEARRSRASPDRRLLERPQKVSRGSPDEGRDHSLS